jgi:clan AA aspartic protease
MGTFFVRIEVGDPEGATYEPVEALVDTGATYTSVPASLLNKLGVTPHDRLQFIQADGSQYERDIGQTWVQVDGKRVITIVIFAEEDAPPLLGAYTLEGVRLAPDPINRRLVSVPGYLVTRWPAADEAAD